MLLKAVLCARSGKCSLMRTFCGSLELVLLLKVQERHRFWNRNHQPVIWTIRSLLDQPVWLPGNEVQGILNKDSLSESTSQPFRGSTTMRMLNKHCLWTYEEELKCEERCKKNRISLVWTNLKLLRRKEEFCGKFLRENLTSCRSWWSHCVQSLFTLNWKRKCKRLYAQVVPMFAAATVSLTSRRQSRND